MKKNDIFDFIKKRGIWYEITEHGAVYNMEDLSKVDMPYPLCDAKNLFVRDDKKKNYYLIVVKGDKRVNLKEFRKSNNTRPLTFASSDDLSDIMGLFPGAVSPLGILNDKDLMVSLYFDEDFMKDDKVIGIHPNDNTATLWLKIDDLIDIIKEHGNSVSVVSL